MPIAIPCKKKKCGHTVQYGIHLNSEEYEAWVEAQKARPGDGVKCPHCGKEIEKRRKQSKFECLHHHAINYCSEYPHSKVNRKHK